MIETIKVRAEGVNIERGIYRELPTTYRHSDLDFMGFSIEAQIKILSIKRDGRPEPWYEEGLDNGLQFTWNVTGNGWRFPIERARARINLPKGVTAETQVAWTGTFMSSNFSLPSVVTTKQIIEEDINLEIAYGLLLVMAFLSNPVQLKLVMSTMKS